MKIDTSKLNERKMPQYCKCDECGQMFALNLKERYLPKGGKWAKERFFVCPVCKHEYVVCKFDKNGLHERTRFEMEMEGVEIKD